MRLHTALEHISEKRFQTMEPWAAGELDEMTSYITHYADEIIEFTFDYMDTDDKGDTLQTFIEYANMLWDHEMPPLPAEKFWVSWVQKVLDQSVRMAAFCEQMVAPSDGRVMGLTVRVMFEKQRGTGFSFINQLGHLVLGDHKKIMMNYADNDSSALLVENGIAIVKALMGALATPRAVRREEPAPVKLNKSRAKKGRGPIRSVIIIDVHASTQRAISMRGKAGYKVEMHWRRPHLRTLPSGTVVPVAPAWVNLDENAPIKKPEYLVRM